MGHGTRNRAGRLLRAGAVMLTVGSVGCFSGDKMKRNAGPSALLPLPSGLPSPTVPIPSAAAKAPTQPVGAGIATLVPRTSTVPPGYSMTQTAEPSMLQQQSPIGTNTFPGSAAGHFSLPGNRSAASTPILHAPVGDMTTPLGVRAGLPNPIPQDPPVLAATQPILPPTINGTMPNSVPNLPTTGHVENMSPHSPSPGAGITPMPPVQPAGSLVPPSGLGLGR
ncbi:MAG: hypothetical protein ACRC7O_14510 [Fimbriiglobus sp.]